MNIYVYMYKAFRDVPGYYSIIIALFMMDTVFLSLRKLMIFLAYLDLSNRQ